MAEASLRLRLGVSGWVQNHRMARHATPNEACKLQSSGTFSRTSSSSGLGLSSAAPLFSGSPASSALACMCVQRLVEGVGAGANTHERAGQVAWGQQQLLLNRGPAASNV